MSSKSSCTFYCTSSRSFSLDLRRYHLKVNDPFYSNVLNSMPRDSNSLSAPFFESEGYLSKNGETTVDYSTNKPVFADKVLTVSSPRRKRDIG